MTDAVAKLCQTVIEAASLVFSKHANYPALDLDLIGRHDDRAHFGIGRLQANLPRPFAVETFQGSFILSDQCHHDVAPISSLGLLAHHIIAIHDVVFNHGGALNLQYERSSTAREVSER